VVHPIVKHVITLLHNSFTRRAFWVFRGGFCNRLDAKVTVNHGLTEAVVLTALVNRLTVVGGLTQLPWLIHINQGGYLNLPALVKILTEAVDLCGPPLINV
jgi:hypothetical protein